MLETLNVGTCVSKSNLITQGFHGQGKMRKKIVVREKSENFEYDEGNLKFWKLYFMKVNNNCKEICLSLE